MEDFKRKFLDWIKLTRDKYMILAKPRRVLIGMMVVGLSILMIHGIYTKISHSFHSNPSPITVNNQPAPVTVNNQPAPVALPAQPVATPGAKFDPVTGKPLAPVAAFDPVTGKPLNPTAPVAMFDPVTGKPLAGTAPVSAVTPVVAGAASTANKTAAGIQPAEPLSKAVIERTLDRVLQVETSTGPVDLLHDTVEKYSFAANSAHNGGFPKPNTNLVAHYVSYVRIDTAGTYSFSALTTSDRVEHDVRIFLNDGPVSDVSKVTWNGGTFNGGVISSALALSPGYYKIEVEVRQNYATVAPVNVSLRMKGESDSAMHDFVPVLINPVQPEPVVAPVAVAPVAGAVPATASPVTHTAAAPLAATVKAVK